MLTLADINNIEFEDGNMIDDLEYYQSVQRAINSGAWTLQGSYGRLMMDAIRSGYCMLGRDRFKDYYGNVIPSRIDVYEGSQGSYEYVKAYCGSDWADAMEAL